MTSETQNWIIRIWKFVLGPFLAECLSVGPDINDSFEPSLKGGSLRDFVLGRLNVLSKADSLNIYIQAPLHVKTPNTSISNLGKNSTTHLYWIYIDLEQGFPTHGPQAACGSWVACDPRGNFVRPAKLNAFIHTCWINEIIKSKYSIIWYFGSINPLRLLIWWS